MSENEKKSERTETMIEVEVLEELVDIEEYSKTGKKPPKAKRYVIKIDKEKYTVSKPSMTGREILVLAGKNPPERFQLNQKFRGGHVEPIRLDQVVDFTQSGVEKFTTIPLDQNEG